MTGHSFCYNDGINGQTEIALSGGSFAEVDKAFAETVNADATPFMKPVTEPWGKEPAI